MNKVPLTFSFEEDKLEAMEIFLKKEGSNVQKKMEEALKKLYEEAVPEAVREFVDAKASGKPKRPTLSPKSKFEPKPKPGSKEEAIPHVQT